MFAVQLEKILQLDAIVREAMPLVNSPRDSQASQAAVRRLDSARKRHQHLIKLPECNITGLPELLSKCNIIDKLGAAVAWCEEQGLDDVQEIKLAKMEAQFVDALGLKEGKKRVVTNVLGSAMSGNSVATLSHC